LLLLLFLIGEHSQVLGDVQSTYRAETVKRLM